MREFAAHGVADLAQGLHAQLGAAALGQGIYTAFYLTQLAIELVRAKEGDAGLSSCMKSPSQGAA